MSVLREDKSVVIEAILIVTDAETDALRVVSALEEEIRGDLTP